MKRLIKQIWKTVKYWAQLLLLPVYGISFLAPRDKKVWVLGSTFGNRWADNARYFYLYLSQFERENIRPIWISRKKEIVSFLQEQGQEAYYVRSLCGIYYCLRAKVYIFDNYSKDICFWLSGGAVKVNLWHGSGNKKTNYDNKFDYLRHPRNWKERVQTWLIRISNEKPTDYTLATSPMMADIFVSAFATDHAHIIEEGYPRNDMLFDTGIQNICTKEEQAVCLSMQEAKAQGHRLVVYMPTFRASEVKFFEIMDLQLLNRFLQEERIIFYTKMHPKSKVKDAFAKVQYSNIVNIGAEVDPYTFLKYIDLLVTDYSSIYSDYLMLNRPSVLFPYDFAEYSADTRECYFSYEEYMPEIKAYTMAELMQYIKKALTCDEGENGRLALRKKIFTTADGYASKRLYRKICEIIGLQSTKTGRKKVAG